MPKLLRDVGAETSEGMQGIRIQDEGAAVRRRPTVLRHGMYEIRTENEGVKPMISQQQLFAEMERQLQLAKRAGDERTVRESLAAIRSLCEVVLGGEAKPEVPAMPNTSFETNVLEEEDANGGSIFDF